MLKFKIVKLLPTPCVSCYFIKGQKGGRLRRPHPQKIKMSPLKFTV